MKTPHTNEENSLQKSSLGSDSDNKFKNDALPEKIGVNLRQIYDDVLAEPVPDDFLSLLAKADKNTS